MITRKKEDREIEFIKRTRNNYMLLKDSTQYDVTLLINSSIGMLIFINQKYNIEDYLVEPDLLDELLNCVDPDENGDDLVTSLSQFCRHLRNAIAHGNFELKIDPSNYKNQDGTITHVLFEDYDDDKHTNLTARITMSVELLEKFYLKFSENVANWIG